jgi:hypothetical protein
VLADLMRGGSQREQTYLCAAHAYLRTGRSRAALRWLNIGVQRLFPDFGKIATDLAMGDNGFELLRERSTLRRQLGETADAVDEAFDSAVRHGDEVLHTIEDLREQSKNRDVVLYWPEHEFIELRRLFPNVSPETHVEHRREVQEVLSRRDARRALAVGTVADFRRYTGSHGLPGAEVESRARYARDLVRRGEVGRWPPDRNEPCWCGSGHKYKRCCGSPGFGEG